MNRRKKGAEAGGFEPPVRLPARQFSKLLVSATHPNFLSRLLKTDAFALKCGAKLAVYFVSTKFSTDILVQNDTIGLSIVRFAHEKPTVCSADKQQKTVQLTVTAMKQKDG